MGVGHVGTQTCFGIAWELQLSFHVPEFARSEAMLLHPGTEPLIEILARAPYAVLADLGPTAAVDARRHAAAVFDTLASWVVHAASQVADATTPGEAAYCGACGFHGFEGTLVNPSGADVGSG